MPTRADTHHAALTRREALQRLTAAAATPFALHAADIAEAAQAGAPPKRAI